VKYHGNVAVNGLGVPVPDDVSVEHLQSAVSAKGTLKYSENTYPIATFFHTDLTSSEIEP
jgi:hypothetical protein